MLLGVTDYIVYNGDNHRELKKVQWSATVHWFF